MVYRPDYSKDLFKQVQDMIKKCDDLSSEIKEERKKSKKEKLTIKRATHAKSDLVNPKLYWSRVNDFLNKYVK